MLFVIWYVAGEMEIFSPYVLPTPGKVAESAWKMLISGEMLWDILISSARVLKGFFIAFIMAFSFGMFKLFLPGFTRNYEVLIQFFRNVPPLAMIPLLILWCGIGETTKIVIIVLAAFFPMYLSIVKGFTGCDRKLLEVGEVFGYNRTEKFVKIILPYALADILVGMRIGLGYSWRAIIGAEMVAAASGLGHLILFAQQLSRTDRVIVGILVIGLVGVLTDKVFAILIRRYLKGAGENGWD